MLKNSKISTNLIAVSLISILMVLWLGSRYLADAKTQFSGAMQLQRSVAPETTLFEMAHNLKLERSIIQDILISTEDASDGRLDKLDEISNQTALLFDRVKEEIRNSRPKRAEKIQHRYNDKLIENLIADLDDKFNRISLTNTFIVSQVYVPPGRRDDSIRMTRFDAYTNLIIAVNTLRKRTHAIPEINYSGVLATHDAKNSIWDARESIEQTIALLESYIQKTKLSALETIYKDNLSLRILQQNERAGQSISDLNEMVQGEVITGDLAVAVTDLKSLYDGAFRDYVKKISIAVADGWNSPISLEESNDISVNIKNKIQNLTETALSTTLKRANSVYRAATTTLLLNTLLILLFMAMAYGSYRVSKRIQHQADHDDLTGITNRRKFSESLNSLFRRTDTSKQEKLVLMTLDLNGFKKINDTMGHAIGDKLLRGVAQRMNAFQKADMSIARTGGDEFSIAFTTEDPDSAYQFACQIKDAIDPPFSIDDSLIKIDTSVGYSTYPDDASTVEQLQITSDFAMFNAKQSGSKKIQPYDREIAAQFENRITIEKDLSSAIENNELELYYQPQFNLPLNRVNAAEALVRWNHPTRGMVPPVEFIGVAEETGLMPAIGDWVLNEACRQSAAWNNSDNFPIRIAVNVSVHQIMQSDFVADVIETMHRHNVSPECLELEITESVVMGDIELIVKCLQELKSAGLKIALDDFGTGYSSLSQLQNLPLDTLKIDRSFIQNIHDDSGSMKSVTATIASIAEIYGMETVAEGIETEEQLNAVRNLGIDVAQGYYYSKPLPTDQVPDVVNSINSQANKHPDTNFKNAA